MWAYSKKLQYPVSIKNKDLSMAKYIITQFGGPNGELGASLRYLTQRYAMPDDKGKALLTDIGSEELGHMEMVSSANCWSNNGRNKGSWIRSKLY